MIGESHRLTHRGSRWALHSRAAQIPACWTTEPCPYRSTTILTGIAYSDFQSGKALKCKILHPALLTLALSWPGGPCGFPSGESILLLPIWPCCPLHLLYVPGLRNHLLTANNILWLFFHSFEMLMRLSCFPPSPKLGTFHTLILWSVWRGKAHGSHVPVCIVVPFGTAYSWTK